MVLRVILWIIGVGAVLLYARVAHFAFATLSPHLGCSFAPETRFWGYGPDEFAICFDAFSQAVRSEYISVLLGPDRMLAVTLTAFLVIWALGNRQWIGVAAGLGYGVSDWLENAHLVAALSGNTSAIGVASLLTMSKFACLTLAIAALLWGAFQKRSKK